MILELFLEIFVEVYLNIGEILVPEKKFKKWQENLLKVLSVFVCCAVIFSVIAGIALLVDGIESLRVTGIAVLCTGVGLFIIQIILVVIAVVHDVKKYKAKKQNNDN